MLRLRHLTALLTLAALAAGPDNAPPARAATKLDRLLPANTGLVWLAPHPGQLRDSFRATPFGKLLDDKNFKPFLQHLEAQLKNQDGLELLGFTVSELTDLAGGEAAYAVVEAGNGQAAQVVLIDVSGKTDVLGKVLAARSKRWKERGGMEEEDKAGDITLTVQSKDAQRRIHARKGDVLVVGDNLGVVKALLQRQPDASDSLAGSKTYQAVNAQTRARDGERPQLYFYLDPWKLAPLNKPADAGPPKRDPADMLRKQGFEAVKGVGGWLTFAHPDFDLYFRSAVHAPKPYANGMRMLKMLSGKDFQPEAWARPPFAVYTTFYLDVPGAFDAFDPVFDMVANDGKPGAWQDYLKALKEETDGPQLDFRKEIVGELSNRVTSFTDSAEPITRRSARFLVGIKAKNPAALRRAIERFVADDPRVKRRTFQGHTILEIPGRTPKRKPGQPASRPVERTGAALPSSALAVADGYLFLASHVDLVETVLRKDGRKSLSTMPEYKAFQKAVAGLNGEDVVGQQFIDLAEDNKVAYELARKGELEGAESTYAAFYRQFLESSKAEGIAVHYDKLPPFKAIAKYLSYAGGVSRNTPNGWEVTGFVLKSK